MKINKELMVAVLATFCLTATLFMIVPTRSQTGSYSARRDVNGDGTIDMADISMSIDGFMTNGDPILPVNITEHATQLIHVADGIVVLPDQTWEGPLMNIDGYSKVTFNIYLAAGINGFALYTYGGVSIFYVDNIYNFTNGYLVKTYDVPHPLVGIKIWNGASSAALLYVDVYLVA